MLIKLKQTGDTEQQYEPLITSISEGSEQLYNLLITSEDRALLEWKDLNFFIASANSEIRDDEAQKQISENIFKKGTPDAHFI